ncbi:MAG: PDZ domain-containing protein [Flavobacteriales bacterium]|nr:PDZ domain-containing protein [Flavobacteriales bacterium]MCB9197368.1 PDZ domain-containing protein [Flavobacteriales bacterium]
MKIRNGYALLAFGLGVYFTSIAQVTSDEEKLQTTLKVPQLIANIELMYVEAVDKNELERNLVRGLYNGISPFSVYQDEAIIKSTISNYKEDYESIGIKFKFSGDSLEIKELIKDGGAEKAGLQVGDKIYEIDGKNFGDEYYYCEVFNRLIGAPNSKVSISYSRGGKLNKVEVTRLPIDGQGVVIIGDKDYSGSINTYKDALPFFDAIYADSVSNGFITEYGIRYMLEQLDPHSSYISLEDLHDMEAPLQGSFTGVGVRFQIDKDTIVVAEPIPGGPSEKVGIMAGDKFIYIGDELVAGIGISNSGVRERLLGEKGTKVKVKMLRKGVNELLTFTIERDKIPIYSLDASYMAAPGIGYIKLNNFSATTVDEAREAINDLKRDGMKDLIIDLQSNGGGYLMTAVNLVDELLNGSKTVVYTEGRAYPKKLYNTRYKGLLEEGRVIILVDQNSASASEIVSGAIQDWDRGLIVGRRTFSKGLVQKPVSLPDGTTVRITTSRYYTPSGRCIQKPYDHGSIEYRKEKYDRYETGELFHADSIHKNLDDVHYTLEKHRAVYGGEGIIPDVFVPLDTTGTSEYFSALIRNGVFSRYSLNYVNDHREELQKKYPTFDSFNKNFKSEKIIKELIDYAKSEGVEYDDKSFKEAENTILIRLKANIAQNLYDRTKFYEVINDLNKELQVAIEILQSGKEFKVIE